MVQHEIAPATLSLCFNLESESVGDARQRPDKMAYRRKVELGPTPPPVGILIQLLGHAQVHERKDMDERFLDIA